MPVTAIDPRRRAWLLFLAVTFGQLLLISAQVNTRSGVRLLSAITFGAFSRVQRAASGVLGSVTGAWSRYVDLRGVQTENERLQREVVDLGVQLQQERALARRGERLGLLLKLQSAMAHRTLAADVIAGDATSYFRTVTINRGTNDGVRRDLAVVAPGGVVGRIVGDPSRVTARVQLLIDRTAGAGALIERSRAGGVVAGDGEMLRMEYVSPLADVAVGDVVVSSGLDGIYPRGFVIGRVAAVKGAGVSRQITVRPSVDFSALEEVLVVVDGTPAGTPGAGAETGQ
jgi:rod shape-determining protein MreC